METLNGAGNTLAQYLYRNLWGLKEVRTLILGVLVLSICFLLELIFLFFQADLEKSFLGILFWEFSLFERTFIPLLTIFHLIVWGLMFLSTIIVYAMIREYAGGKTGLLEIGGIIIIFLISGWLIFGELFTIFLVGVLGIIIGYLYLSLQA